MSQFKRFGVSSKHAEIGLALFGIVVCRFVVTVLFILGLGLPQFWAKTRFEIEDFWPDP